MRVHRQSLVPMDAPSPKPVRGIIAKRILVVCTSVTALWLVRNAIASARQQELMTSLVQNPNAEVSQYLDQMRSYLRTPPRDGVFGADRIPNLHGQDAYKIQAFRTIKSLENKIQIRSATIGFHRIQDSIEPEPPSHNQSKARITSVHLLTSESSFLDDDKPNTDLGTWHQGLTTQEAFATKYLRNNTQDTVVQKIEFNGKPGWIMAKAVRASEDSCYSCHKEIKHSEPIGYVEAMLSSN